jgi:hypothetical protein
MLYLDADNITSSTVLIRGVEGHSEMGVSSGFDLGSGSNLDIDIDLQSDNGGCCSYVTGGFNSNAYSSLNIKIDGSATGNRVELDYDYTGLSTYHHVDIDIDGGSNAIYFDDGDADHSNTSLEIDIEGTSNLVYPTMGGTQQTAKIFIDGDSNTVYSWLHGTGSYATGQTSLASLNADQYNAFIYIVGNSNYIKHKTKNDSTTRLIVQGNSNKITEYIDRDDWMLNGEGDIYIDINGDNNLIGAKIQGWPAGGYGASDITIDVDSDDVQIDVNQHGGGNSAEIKVYGSSNYDFVLDVHQSQNHNFVMCFNRAHQSSNYNGDFNSQSNHSESWNSSTIYSTGSAADCI